MQDRDVTAQIWAKKRATQIEEIFFSLRGIMNLPPRHPCSDASLAIRNKSDPSMERRETPHLRTDFSQSTPFMCRTWNLLIGKDLNHSKGWARTQIYSYFVCRSLWFTVSNALLRSNFDNPYAVYIKTPLLGKNRKGGNCYVKRSKAELTWI